MTLPVKIFLVLFAAGFAACENTSHEKSAFELVIQSEAYHLPKMTRYYITQDSLKVFTMNSATLKTDSVVLRIAITDDSLPRLYMLNPKSYSCNEQHGLDDTDVQLIRNDSALAINPGVNHPKELDIAVRIINAHVPESFRLKFEDLQPAIFQTDDHSM